MTLSTVDTPLGFGSVDLSGQMMASDIDTSAVELVSSAPDTSVDSMGMGILNYDDYSFLQFKEF